jgi:Ras-related GTP-binding protein A/B
MQRFITVGALDGCFGEWEDVDAIGHLVRCVPSIEYTCVLAYSVLSCCSNNNTASLTARLGATIDVEQNLVRFFGDLILNLWDCGGQDVYMESYLSTQRSTIFANVGVLIYVFDVGTGPSSGVGGGVGGGPAGEGGAGPGGMAGEGLGYFEECIEALEKYSPDANVFVLVHKMDLVQKVKRAGVLERRAKELEGRGINGTNVTVFGTSIYDESLYKVRFQLLLDI